MSRTTVGDGSVFDVYRPDGSVLCTTTEEAVARFLVALPPFVKAAREVVCYGGSEKLLDDLEAAAVNLPDVR